MKYLIINMTKNMKDSYTKNNKVTLIEIKDLNNGKISYIHGSEKLPLLRCQFFHNSSIDYTHPPRKISAFFLFKLTDLF